MRRSLLWRCLRNSPWIERPWIKDGTSQDPWGLHTPHADIHRRGRRHRGKRWWSRRYINLVECYKYKLHNVLWRNNKGRLSASHKSRGRVRGRHHREGYSIVSYLWNRIEGGGWKKSASAERSRLWGSFGPVVRGETLPCPRNSLPPLSLSFPYAWILLFPAAEPQSRSYLT